MNYLTVYCAMALIATGKGTYFSVNNLVFRILPKGSDYHRNISNCHSFIQIFGHLAFFKNVTH